MAPIIMSTTAIEKITRGIKASKYRSIDKNNSIWIICPFPRHGSIEDTPSLSVNLDPTGDVPVGIFHCLGCGESGHYNKLAAQIGAPQLTREDQVEYKTKKQKVSNHRKVLLDEEDDDVDEDFFIDYPKDKMWRTIPGKLLVKLGTKLCFNEKTEKMLVVLRCLVNGEEVGYIKASMKRSKMSYKNKEGIWIKRKGLYPYDHAAKMLDKKKVRYVVLVEGARDAIKLIELGVPALAILGSQAWTKEKAELLLSLGVDRVILCMDGDTAGWRATKKIFSTLKDYVDLTVIDLRPRTKLKGQKVDPGNSPRYVKKIVDKILAKH